MILILNGYGTAYHRLSLYDKLTLVPYRRWPDINSSRIYCVTKICDVPAKDELPFTESSGHVVFMCMFAVASDNAILQIVVASLL